MDSVYFYSALTALQSLPRSALEVARIDGATRWQQIVHIKLPLMMPVLIVTCLLRLIDTFNVLEVILGVTKSDLVCRLKYSLCASLESLLSFVN